MLKGGRPHVAEHIRRTAVAALKDDILPKVAELLPAELERFWLHDVSLVGVTLETDTVT
jgi:hypothetical protein